MKTQKRKKKSIKPISGTIEQYKFNPKMKYKENFTPPTEKYPIIGENFCIIFDGKDFVFSPEIKYPIKKGEWYHVQITRGTDQSSRRGVK